MSDPSAPQIRQLRSSVSSDISDRLTQAYEVFGRINLHESHVEPVLPARYKWEIQFPTEIQFPPLLSARRALKPA